MSRASKITLAATSLFALGTVGIVHFQQRFEQTAMHEGVVRDMEQQRLKQERKLDFDLQRALEAEYKGADRQGHLAWLAGRRSRYAKQQ
ncbi:unnamed protein product [Parascedosporium putredinis]|uniref:Cytochrome c oxidase assembly protein n=1 Tax=Parascedosporium putredinis TaxID=1442378 RepID=A0A9P1H2V6_9PEZI|nr:unnamed protein product [Parascedosporium putredinis]CAI7995320.1 unnamed protein product [Parascedosporium putredinis]